MFLNRQTTDSKICVANLSQTRHAYFPHSFASETLLTGLFSETVTETADIKQRTVDCRGLIAVMAETPLSFLLNKNWFASKFLSCYSYLI